MRVSVIKKKDGGRNLTIPIGGDNLFDVYTNPLVIKSYPTPERYGGEAVGRMLIAVIMRL